MRRRLLAIPSSDATHGVRLDWSPKFREFIVYVWKPNRRSLRWGVISMRTYRFPIGKRPYSTPWESL